MQRTWLKERRVRARLNCKDMADKVGVSESYYYMLEAGDRQQNMDMDTALRIAKALDTEWQEIFREEIEYERNRAHSA